MHSVRSDIKSKHIVILNINMQLLWAIESIPEVKAFNNVMKIKRKKLKIFRDIKFIISI